MLSLCVRNPDPNGFGLFFDFLALNFFPVVNFRSSHVVIHTMHVI